MVEQLPADEDGIHCGRRIILELVEQTGLGGCRGCGGLGGSQGVKDVGG